MSTPISEEVVKALVNGLHHIGVLSTVSDVHAATALSLIRKIYDTLRSGLVGEISAESVEKALQSLKGDLASHDVIADKALADRFDDGDP